MSRPGDGEMMLIFSRAERCSTAADRMKIAGNMCRVTEIRVFNRVSRRERPTYHLASLTQISTILKGFALRSLCKHDICRHVACAPS